MTEPIEPTTQTVNQAEDEQWETFDKKIRFYDEHYEVLTLGTYGVGSKVFLGSRENRKCRFCGLAEPATTFKTVAHAIPAFLGNDQLLLNSECDKCNQLFADAIETHLDKFTRPHRLAAQIRGRNGVPSFKSNDKATRVDFKHMMVISTPQDSDFAILDEENKTLTLNITREPYIPVAVYKALCKIAVSIIQNESDVADFLPTIRWIRDPDHEQSILKPLRVAVTSVPGPRPFDGVSVFLLRRKTSATLPYCIFILALGNYMYQLMVPALPDIARGNKLDCRMPQFPAPFENPWPFGEIKFGMLDCTSSDYVTRDAPMSFSFLRSYPAGADEPDPRTQGG